MNPGGRRAGLGLGLLLLGGLVPPAAAGQVAGKPAADFALPELERLHQQLAARGVVIVGISLDKERKNALDLAGALKLKFKLLHDPEGKVAEVYDPPKMPSSYVIDRDGVVRFVNEGFSGAADVAKLKRQLEQLSPPNAAGEAPPPG